MSDKTQNPRPRKRRRNRSAAERLDENRRIAVRRDADGCSWQSIAEEFDLSVPKLAGRPTRAARHSERQRRP